jgi:hypothetical protein
VKPGAYPRVEHLKGAFFCEALALPSNIRLGWKGLLGANTLTYYNNPKIAAVKSFIVQAPEELIQKFMNECNHYLLK